MGAGPWLGLLLGAPRAWVQLPPPSKSERWALGC